MSVRPSLMPCPASRRIEFRFLPSSPLRTRMSDDFLLLARAQDLTDEQFFTALERMVPRWT